MTIPGLTLILLLHNNMVNSTFLSIAGLVAGMHTNAWSSTIARTAT